MNGMCRTLPILGASPGRAVGSCMNSSNVSATAGERQENASQALGEGGKVPDPPEIALSNKGLIQGCGAELGCSQTRYGGGSGSGCTEGAHGGCGRWQRGPGWPGGSGGGSGDPFVAGRLRAWSTAAVTWERRDRAGAANATCPGPEP